MICKGDIRPALGILPHNITRYDSEKGMANVTELLGNLGRLLQLQITVFLLTLGYWCHQVIFPIGTKSFIRKGRPSRNFMI